MFVYAFRLLFPGYQWNETPQKSRSNNTEETRMVSTPHDLLLLKLKLQQSKNKLPVLCVNIFLENFSILGVQMEKCKISTWSFKTLTHFCCITTR